MKRRQSNSIVCLFPGPGEETKPKMKLLFLAVLCGVALADVYFEERFDDGGNWA
jgi:hypothetical protein